MRNIDPTTSPESPTPKKKRAPRKPKAPVPAQERSTVGGPFRKNDPRINRTIPGPGRTAGYTHFMAQLTAQFLDSKVSEEDQRPFMQAVLERLKTMAVEGNMNAIKLIVEKAMSDPSKVDDILSGQKNKDMKFLQYQIYDRLFDQQQAVLNTKKHRVVMVCGRRSGKTEVIAARLVIAALSHDRGDVLYVGKTRSSAYDIVWKRIVDLLTELNVEFQRNLTDQSITLNTGVNIFVRGAHSIAEIETLRGLSLSAACVDEAQSIKNLSVLLEQIIEPALADFADSQLFISGTPPRTKGNYLETLWNDTSTRVAKFNWNMGDNIHLPGYQDILQRKMEELGYDENSPPFRREYLGEVGVWDIDALVFRPTINNIYDQTSLQQWVQSQRLEDLYFSAGLDLGWSDSDAFVIAIGSTKSPEKFLVYEHKANKQGISQLVEQIHKGQEYIKSHPFLRFVPKFDQMKIWVDSGGGGAKIAATLRSEYRLRVYDAIKTDKALAIDMLREEVRMGRLKFDSVGPWAEECDKIIFERDENDRITSEIDDSFHPDMMDAILYCMRPLWKISKVKVGDVKEVPVEVKPIAVWDADKVQQERVQAAVTASITQTRKDPEWIRRITNKVDEDDMKPWD